MLNVSADKHEISVASQLPYSQQISPTVVVTEAGDYTTTIQIHGVSFATMNHSMVDGLNRTWLNAINTTLATPNHAMWTHIVRTKRQDVHIDA